MIWKKAVYILFSIALIGSAAAFFITSKSFGPAHKDQIETRAVIDIGSGSTKLKVAKVDVQAQKIVHYLLAKQVPIAFEEALQESSDNSLNEKIKELGIKKLSLLKQEAENLGAKKIVAVATAAFRQSKNSAEYVKEIKDKTGIQVIVITQEQEGEIAFKGAVAKCPSACTLSAITWDIGGGSYQITTENGEKGILISKGTLASVSFQNYVITKIQGHSLKETTTPNPISREDAEKGRSYAKSFAESHIDPYVLSKIKQFPQDLFGIGSVFNDGIKPYLVPYSERSVETKINKGALTALIDQLIGLDDPALKSKLQQIYAEKASPHSPTLEIEPSILEGSFSNLLYVAGFMDAMGVDSVSIMEVNNADGILVYPPAWSPSP